MRNIAHIPELIYIIDEYSVFFQVRVDQLSIVGAIAGFAAAKHMGEGGELGALLGVSGGVLLATVYNMLVG